MSRIARLGVFTPDRFPEPERALEDPNGLLAFGGDLSPERLVNAYTHGIFPWYSDGEPLLWWSPDPRCVFATDSVHVSHSLRGCMRHSTWEWSMDRRFGEVMRACAAPRADQDGTWITPDMLTAYAELHTLGFAHSLEIWDGDTLVGGTYGVAIGRMFSAESMFSRRTNASKVALVALAHALRVRGFPWIDAQVPNPHLMRMGARALPRRKFLAELARLANLPQVTDWPRARAPVRSLEAALTGPAAAGPAPA